MITNEMQLAPDGIIAAYYDAPITEAEVLNGGRINTTLALTDANGDKSILQRLSPIFDQRLAHDYDVVSNHLRNEGWQVPAARPSNAGDKYATDQSGSLWRSFEFIESDGKVPDANLESIVALSGLLGNLHRSLAKLDYEPTFSLDHFHDNQYYGNQLASHLDNPILADHRQAGSRASELLIASGLNASDDQQLIHGDPKLANALYRGGQPFTFVDYDTVMRTSPLVDVGDMLRSATGKLYKASETWSSDDIAPVIDAYYETAKPNVSAARFTKNALAAGRLIALELCSRYLIDAVEDHYFEWDSQQFTSRTEQNLFNAQQQWQVYEALR